MRLGNIAHVGGSRDAGGDRWQGSFLAATTVIRYFTGNERKAGGIEDLSAQENEKL